METSIRPTDDTLAAWVMALGPDSPCFCCGSTLKVTESRTTPVRVGSSLLRCPRCGAEISYAGATEARCDDLVSWDPALAAA
jgi:hypothetical protein